MRIFVPGLMQITLREFSVTRNAQISLLRNVTVGAKVCARRQRTAKMSQTVIYCLYCFRYIENTRLYYCHYLYNKIELNWRIKIPTNQRDICTDQIHNVNTRIIYYKI